MLYPPLRIASKRAGRALRLLTAVTRTPEARLALERRLRGEEEFRKLSQADAVFVSYGKAGRTWLRVLISRVYQVRHGLAERHLIGFDNLHWRVPAIPKLMFTHDNYLKDYTGHAEDKRDYHGHKVVLLVRHPADTAVSQFFQWKFRMRDRKKAMNRYPGQGAAVEVGDFIMDPDAGLPKIVAFMNLWAQEFPRLQGSLLLRYEDLRSDTAGQLGRVFEFLGTPASDEELQEAVRFASVENMRQMETKGTFWLAGSRMRTRDKSNPDAYKVRRAKVGGWRDYLDEAKAAEVEAYLRERLNPMFGYTESR
ncbi:sulfotransferase domain-containing protein [Aquibaculum arenosum]|uniref:Sulfotransferase domain-containing protein n=1 Tax=Aquibaculum arenosum TaxID=3032591 RepID=A0ABT5YHF6_9PROT|nr:sulfotransferase domain-containing protein [Fodinicurvata sp. CAU 1616]MDF2094367.1 sulfotransferase domain-containing protein [Fodinicurvata sp. CAU 1616]